MKGGISILYYFGVCTFLLGLVTGSFLNVCIYRIPRGESVVKPPSHCPGCGRRLGALDLVPFFSYVFLRGKCRTCKQKISFRYPGLELLTAGVFTALYIKFGSSPQWLAAAFLMSILIVVFFVDYDHRIIPHGLTLTGLGGGILLTLYSYFRPGQFFGNRFWWDHLLGILPGSGVLFLIALIGLVIYKSDDAMGMGDVYIFAPIGLFLGWKLCFLSLMGAVFIAGITSIFLMLLKKKKRKDPIPFGPFIVTAVFLVLLWGNGFFDWYLNTFVQ